MGGSGPALTVLPTLLPEPPWTARGASRGGHAGGHSHPGPSSLGPGEQASPDAGTSARPARPHTQDPAQPGRPRSADAACGQALGGRLLPWARVPLPGRGRGRGSGLAGGACELHLSCLGAALAAPLPPLPAPLPRWGRGACANLPGPRPGVRPRPGRAQQPALARRPWLGEQAGARPWPPGPPDQVAAGALSSPQCEAAPRRAAGSSPPLQPHQAEAALLPASSG